MDKNYEIATDILEDIRCHIDRDNMNRSRKRWISDEFANKTKALSRCFSWLGAFIDRLARSFWSRIAREQTINHLKTADSKEIMRIFREESQIPVLILQIRRDEAKQKKKQTDTIPGNSLLSDLL